MLQCYLKVFNIRKIDSTNCEIQVHLAVLKVKPIIGNDMFNRFY